MTPPEPHARTERSDVLLSWDRLGFRLLFFGGMAIMWVFQGRALGLSWSKAILGEVFGVMPFAFLAPIVLAMGKRFRMDRLGPVRYLSAHVVGMVLLFIPYWLFVRGFDLATAWHASGWQPELVHRLFPTTRNVLNAFSMVPFIYFLVLLGSEAMRQAQARKEEELQAGRVAGQLAEARLALLQRQLHPHFLFNALQAISTLLHRDPATADALLVRLSTLLRAMLETASGQTLSLRTELDLTRKYLEIEQVRFADRLQVEWEVDASLLEAQVPSLVVLPLVENAIRHGLSPKVGPGHLKISAQFEDAMLLLTVADDGLGATLPLHLGVGIGNTQERLRTMYGEGANLTIETQPGQGLRACIRLPLSEVPA